MRVFICGAQGVGKSTLITSLPEDIGLQIKDSYSKHFLEDNPDIQTSDNKGFNEFQDKIMLFCLSQYVNENNFISSRSIIDSFAYIRANNSENKIMLFNILNHYRDYLTGEDDIYIYLPIEFDISLDNNKYRNIDPDYQMLVDEEMIRYFEKLKALGNRDNFYILKGDREARLEQLINIIKSRKKYV